MQKIDVNNCHVSHKIVNKEITSLARFVLLGENISEYSIGIIFVDTSYIVKLNKEFLKKSYSTDVLSFSLSESDSPLSGEVYINLDKIVEQAKEYKVTYKAEMQRIVVHGLLHLCGHVDDTEIDRNKMTAKEDDYLNLFSVGDEKKMV